MTDEELRHRLAWSEDVLRRLEREDRAANRLLLLIGLLSGLLVMMLWGVL